MYDATWQTDDTAWGCDCADCRMYRVWETEGTDDWEPRPDGWTAWAAPSDGSAAANVETTVRAG
ncbi:MAG TPA: hypothetical protein VKA85_09890 [Candidatus Limnocylindrales bacterium]|nr:hypothetical protein [Candidatus Limnocylindrales bacterium]